MNITTDEMVDDWYAAKLDALCCEKLLASCQESESDEERLARRLRGNKKVMTFIEVELEKRGEIGRVRHA